MKRLAALLAGFLLAGFIATPAEAAVYTVPTSINSTCSTNVLPAVQSFINGVPDGSSVRFQPDGCYLMNGTLELAGRNDLTLNGQGATFKTSATSDGNRAQLRLVDGTNWTVRNLIITGSSTVGGTPGAFVDTLQWQHGVDLRGVATALISNVRVTDVYGDCYYVGMDTDSTAWSTDVHVTNSTCRRNGRQGVSVVAGQRVTVDTTILTAIALMTFDMEPNGATGGAKNVDIVSNTLGTGPRQQALGIVGGGTVSDITFSSNTLTSKALTVWVQADQDGGRRTDIAVQNNTSDTALAAGYAIDATGVDGLTVTGNTQPITGTAAFRHTVDCTATTFSGNIT